MQSDKETEGYYRFTGKQRLEKAINTLSGVVQGIAADGVVKPGEVEELSKWVSDHREFAHRHPFNEVVPLLDAILDDGGVDEEELADLRWVTERISSDRDYWDDVTGDMQELQGFLQGILADGRINEAELDQLSKWVDARSHLRACWPYDELESIIAEVMKDGVIDDQEHEALLQFFGEFVAEPGRQAVGALDRDTTVSGVWHSTQRLPLRTNYSASQAPRIAAAVTSWRSSSSDSAADSTKGFATTPITWLLAPKEIPAGLTRATAGRSSKPSSVAGTVNACL